MIKTTLYIFTQKQFFSLEKVCYQVYVKLNASKTKENVKLKCKHYEENSPLCHPFPTHAFIFHFIGLIFVKIIKRRASVFDFL